MFSSWAEIKVNQPKVLRPGTRKWLDSFTFSDDVMMMSLLFHVAEVLPGSQEITGMKLIISTVYEHTSCLYLQL